MTQVHKDMHFMLASRAICYLVWYHEAKQQKHDMQAMINIVK